MGVLVGGGVLVAVGGRVGVFEGATVGVRVGIGVLVDVLVLVIVRVRVGLFVRVYDLVAVGVGGRGVAVQTLQPSGQASPAGTWFPQTSEISPFSRSHQTKLSGGQSGMSSRGQAMSSAP